MTTPQPERLTPQLARPDPAPTAPERPEPDLFDPWDSRKSWLVSVLPYCMLAVSSLLTLFVTSESHQTTEFLLVVAAVTAGWMLWMFTLHPTWRDRPTLMAVFFVGLVVLMAVLVIRGPWFGFFTFTGYFFDGFLQRKSWRIAGLVAVAVVTGTAQNGGIPKPTVAAIVTYVIILLINIGVAGALNWFAWMSNEQSVKRAQGLAELVETNRKLEITMEENAGLQAQLLNQAREAGIQDERQRMAGEIHDTLAQGLAGIITQLEAAEQAGGSDSVTRRHLNAAASLARESLSEARRSVQALQPEPLESARLPDALAEVADRWSTRTGVTTQVTTTGMARPMRPEIEVTLLRTAQEALANVAKHADASRVGLTLSYMEDLVTLDVRDDGIGFAPFVPIGAVTTDRLDGGVPATSSGPTATGGFGLTAMRQRVMGVSGVLEIESEPGGGTAVSASVPAIPARSNA
jgi:signal transduction histidine kinase